MRKPSAAAAMAFCASSPSAVVITVWPSGTGQLESVRSWIQDAGAAVVHEATVPLDGFTADLASIMALYDGEDWLESNCWYFEQPLVAGPPNGPYAGAKWKHALCFRNEESRHPHALVCDVSGSRSSLWSTKYAIRRSLAAASGNPGNSCIHLTDEQSTSLLAAHQAGRLMAGGGYGMACDDSYAFACARALLHPVSLAWLNSAELDALSLGSADFRHAWSKYTAWLREPLSVDSDVQHGQGDVAARFL